MAVNVLRKGLLISLIAGLFMIPVHVQASGESTQKSDSTSGEEKFTPGPMILEHITDNHSWHILTYTSQSGEKTDVAVPLPVILYSTNQGLVVFMSSRFEHRHSAYKGFSLGESGENKGKIVEQLPGGQEVIPIDLSITKNVLALLVSIALILWIFLSIAATYKRNPLQAPSGMQSFFEPIILFVRDDIARSIIGEKKYERYLPYLLTIFFFILVNNFLGLIPIIPFGANVTGNIAVTMVLAVFTFVITTISGNKNYWLHIIDMPGVPWWLKYPPFPLMPFIEILGIFIKPFVLMIRLFANITAGHLIPLGFFSLIFIFGAINPFLGYGVSIVSVAFSLFMGLLEILVALIQAYVFTLLSALYFGMATEEHEHKAEHVDQNH